MRTLVSSISVCLVFSATLTGQRPNLDELRAATWAAVEEKRSELESLSKRIWRFAETSLQENRSSAALAEFMEANGFTVKRGVADIPTAFVASYGAGKPVVGILAEFDALPGLSNQAVARLVPMRGGGGGHGCGHNLFAAGSAGAAIAAKAVKDAWGLPGTIVLFGCPAEETVIGKVYMAKAGVFDGLDVCLDWHPSSKTGADFATTRALNNFKVRFYGRTAHGASDPWNGRSALDAVELMNHAVNMLREHVKPSTRIHYVVSNGGGAPNVVPAQAEVWYFVRDLDRAGVQSTYNRVLKCADGAAIATETRHRVDLITGVHAYLLNRPLTELIDRNLKAAGAPDWSEGEQRFAKKIQQASLKPEKGLFVGIQKMPPEELPAPGGSTDVAEVSRLTPTGKLRVASAPLGTAWHAWPVVACSGTTIGHKALRCAARTLGASAVELLVRPEVIVAARAEFERKTRDKPYVCPIPIDRKPPIK